VTSARRSNGEQEQPPDECVDAVDAREHDPVERVRARAGGIQRLEVIGRSMRIMGASMASAPIASSRSTSSAGLIARPGDEDPLPEQRARVEPPQVFAQRDDAATIRTPGRRSVDFFVLSPISARIRPGIPARQGAVIRRPRPTRRADGPCEMRWLTIFGICCGPA